MSEETAIEKEHKGIEILAISIPSFNEICNFGAYESLSGFICSFSFAPK
jgi:hypothetical protein